ncbi:hypothetical protein SMALA_8124 [Streptomyces malaysiensis subsp. malaysiensis]|nr:hypothetical protein SMALA_8124 [Streptomyces malaysiensis]
MRRKALTTRCGAHLVVSAQSKSPGEM